VKKAAVLILLLAGFSMTFGDVPVRKENLVYALLAFNGRDYGPAFATEQADTIYLIAGRDNFLGVRKAMVYYWPLTDEWRTDTTVLNIPFEGTLELIGPRGKTRAFSPVRYTYFNVRGEYELNWKVAQGADADIAWKRWTDLMDAYNAAVGRYQTLSLRYQTDMDTLIARIQRIRNAGGDPEALVDRMSSLVKPEAPAAPDDFIVPPAPVQEAFILNLAPGVYDLRFRAPEGRILEGSEKKLVVHEKRRAQGIGYEVIPGDKWTRPLESTTPSSVLYVNGSSDLFLQPFYQDEYNDLRIAKTVRNDAKGNPNLMKWVRIQQIPGAKIELAGPDFPTVRILEEPFVVQQSSTGSLGYRIVPYEPQGAHKGRQPDLKAFRVPLRPEIQRIQFMTRDRNGTPLAESGRQIRVVAATGASRVLLVLALVPILVMAVVLARRARRYAP
jgi:hypothetical protein